jgi:hypothetical protein
MLSCVLQETVHQANNLAQSDEESEELSETEAAAAPEAAVDGSAGGSQRAAPRSSTQRQRNRPKGKKAAAGAGQAVSEHAQHSSTSAQLHEGTTADSAGHDDSTTAAAAGASSSGSRRVRGPRNGRNSRAAGVHDIAPAAPAQAADASPAANGLHVDDALSAAKHAVQELWVPKRKPMPGRDVQELWLGRILDLLHTKRSPQQSQPAGGPCSCRFYARLVDKVDSAASKLQHGHRSKHTAG